MLRDSCRKNTLILIRFITVLNLATISSAIFNSAAESQAKSSFVYCLATDGHYAIFSDPVLKQLGTINITTSTANWREFVKRSKPSLDLTNESRFGAAQCVSATGQNYLAVKSEEDAAIGALMRLAHASRSFLVSFEP